jgi:hypothetical protein
MKRLYMAAAILLVSGGLALGQGVKGATGPVGSGTTGPTNPNGSAAPGITLAPSVGGTVGQGRSADLGNPPDLDNRGHPRDLTRPGAGDPRDVTE